ncbi:Laccase [Bertholletia excelsa]
MASADTHYYDFILKEANFTRLCSSKSMMVVNNSFPGPVIRVYKGDTVFVNVQNEGNYGLTIHWHGVKQLRNPWSDGPEYITQCAIQPGTNFTYEIIFSTEEGTLWWHAHSDWTRSSVHGAIIIYPRLGTTYPFPQPDEEEVIILGSWYKGDVNYLVAEGLQEGGALLVSDAHLINGQPGDFCNCSKEGTYRRVVDYGKTYLLRIVNAVMNVGMFFAIAQHNLTVVGMDGNYLKPIMTSYIVISPGQTMDVLLTANQPLGLYYMATREYDSTDQDYTEYDSTNTTAILEYKGNYTRSSHPVFPSVLPSFQDEDKADEFWHRLRSLPSHDHSVEVPKEITTRMFITVSMGRVSCRNDSCNGASLGDTSQKLKSSLNNISFVNSNTDVLSAYYWNLSGVYTDDFPDQPPTYFNFTGDDLPMNTTTPDYGTKAKVLRYNESVEVIFQGTNVLDTPETHPMHMHGYHFYVVGFGYGNFNPNVDPKGYNLVDPPQLNTFAVPRKGWVTIRFIANNPGVWYWHCHFDRHMSWGMNTCS